MNRWTVLFAALLIAMGCSSGGGNPTAPTADPDLTGSSSHVGQAQTHLWGYYDVYIDIPTQTATAVLNRNAMFSANVVQFVNGSAMNLQFTINGTPVTPDYIDVDIDVAIRHPFPGLPQYNGYDVRGVFIGNGSKMSGYDDNLIYNSLGQVEDEVMYDFEGGGYDDPHAGLVGMPDGYTRWFNPTEFKIPGLFGYTAGKCATPGFKGTATLNPYKYFADGLDVEDDLWSFLLATPDHGVFSAGSQNTRNYYIRFPVPNPGVKFGYAIVANWIDEDTHPANAPEPIGITVAVTPELYYVSDIDKGGNLVLDINVFDRDAGTPVGPVEDYKIFIESTVLSAVHECTVEEMTPVPLPDPPPFNPFHLALEADNINGNSNTVKHEFWVICEEKDTDYTNPLTPPGGAPSAPLAAFFRHDLYVADKAYNQPPTITSGVDGEVKPIEWTTEQYSVTATDPDGDVLSYSWIVTEEGGTVIEGYDGVPGNGDGTIDIDWGDIAGWTQGPVPYIIYCEVSDGIAAPVEADPLDVEVWVAGDKWVSNHTDFASTPDNGTLTEPYSNINQALSGHASGVKIIVDKGSATYTDVINQSSQPGFTLRSWCFHTTPVGRATFSNTMSQGMNLDHTYDVKIQGFKLQFPSSSYQYYIIYAQYCNNLQVIDNWFTGTTVCYYLNGIYTYGGNSLTVKNNLFSDLNCNNTWNQFTFVYAYYSSSGAYDVSQNEITNIQPNQNNTVNYLQLIYGDTWWANSKCNNNLIHHISPNCGPSYETYIYPMMFYGCNSVLTVGNNVIDEIDGDHAWNYWYTNIYGLYIYNYGASAYTYEAHSNIISNLTGTYTMPYYYGTYLYNIGATYTDVYNVQDSAHGWTGPGVGCITQDPKFVNNTTAPYDYHLDTGSPCIDTGKSGEDMGCYGNLPAGETIVGLLTPKGT